MGFLPRYLVQTAFTRKQHTVRQYLFVYHYKVSTLGKRIVFRKSILFLTSALASKCFDVSMYKSTSDFGWALGNCSGSDEWLGSGTYTDKCCISDESQVLTCSTRSRGRRDWSNCILMMLGHQFCDDFVGHNAFIEINVTGYFISRLINIGLHVYFNYTYVLIHLFSIDAYFVILSLQHLESRFHRMKKCLK